MSMVPPTTPDLSKPPGLNLIATNGSRIKSFGTRPMTLQIDNTKYTWRFQIADVQKSILGADFLRANGLLVDLASKRLINGPSSVQGVLKDVLVDICKISSARDDNAKIAYCRTAGQHSKAPPSTGSSTTS